MIDFIAEARRAVKDSNRTMPYLYLQVQQLVRELSGIRRVFGETPEFTWHDDWERFGRPLAGKPEIKRMSAERREKQRAES